MRNQFGLTAACLLAVQTVAPQSSAQAEMPVAIRWWGQGTVSIETWWNGSIVIDPYNDKIGYEIPNLSADLVLVTHEHSDHNNVDAVGGEPKVVRGLNRDGGVRSIYNALDRWPNQDEAKWRDARLRVARGPHPVQVTSIPAWHDDSEGSERGAVAMFLIEVDGVRILHCGDLGQTELNSMQLEAMGKVDVLLLPVGGVYTIDGPQAWKIVEQVKPRTVVPIHYKTDALTIPLEPIDKFLTHIPAEWKLTKVAHNTLAVVAGDRKALPQGEVVVLNYKPWQPTGELATLLEKMDAACQASQKVFAPLTANQMNWRPPNGSHTPRWNAEHMMGRQLGFFTQIYADIDPAFKHIDLNPKQMPDDYQAAHADWTGAEEARQMQRANAYVRRFAYLLDGVDLDARAPGSRWKLGALLKQMDRHFGEHTANVVKKFELEGWPAE